MDKNEVLPLSYPQRCHEVPIKSFIRLGVILNLLAPLF